MIQEQLQNSAEDTQREREGKAETKMEAEVKG